MKFDLLSEMRVLLANYKASVAASRRQPVATTGSLITVASRAELELCSAAEEQIISGTSYFAAALQLADKCKPEIIKQLNQPIPLCLEYKLTLDALVYKSLVAALRDFVKTNKYRLVVAGKSQHEIKDEDLEAVLGSLSILKQEEAPGLGAQLMAK